jgi:hypothetical protein
MLIRLQDTSSDDTTHFISSFVLLQPPVHPQTQLLDLLSQFLNRFLLFNGIFARCERTKTFFQ